MWRALVAGVVFGHASPASLLRELGRNPALLGLCGFDPLGRQAPTRRTVVRDAATGKTSDADWGRHETRGVDKKTGRPWTKVKTWFGYGLHVIADVEHEIPAWFAVTAASASEQPVLSAGVDGLFAAEPALAERCADFCADRGLDGGPLKRKLWDAYGVRPLVDVREPWREEKREPGYDPAQPILRSLAADGGGNVLHGEKGGVFCRCPATGEVRPMAFQGFEADRDALKYRCPAAAYGLDCRGRAACLRDAGSKAGDYGRVVRVGLATSDRRMFTPTPWGSPSWKRGYNRRGALERINARLDGSFGFECHFVRGRAKMTTRLGLAVAVMMALALGAVRAGRPERMCSLVDPGCRSRPSAAAPRFRGESTVRRRAALPAGSPNGPEMRTICIREDPETLAATDGTAATACRRRRDGGRRVRPRANRAGSRRKTLQRKSLTQS